MALILESGTGVRAQGKRQNLVKFRVVPDVIDSVPPNSVKVSYPSGAVALQGNLITPLQAGFEPFIRYPAKDDELYTVMIIDPDIPAERAPLLAQFIHYMVINIPGSDVKAGNTTASYLIPIPVVGTHRYVCLVYHQKNGAYKTALQLTANLGVGRPFFDNRRFAAKHGLGQPIAANFFRSRLL